MKLKLHTLEYIYLISKSENEILFYALRSLDDIHQFTFEVQFLVFKTIIRIYIFVAFVTFFVFIAQTQLICIAK